MQNRDAASTAERLSEHLCALNGATSRSRASKRAPFRNIEHWVNREPVELLQRRLNKTSTLASEGRVAAEQGACDTALRSRTLRELILDRYATEIGACV